MTLKRVEFQEMIVANLKAAHTAAGDKIFAVFDFPTESYEYPIIIVHEPTRTPLETKQSLGPNAPQFTTTAIYQIEARLEGIDKTEVNNALNVLDEKIKRALINDYSLTRKIQQFASVETYKDFNTDGKNCLGQISVNLSLEFYEGPEDFASIDADDLDGINVTIDTQSPTDPSGFYANPAFPEQVVPAPRGMGPDGRAEATLYIDLSQKDETCT